MSGIYENLLFKRGATYGSGAITPNTGGANLLGKIVFQEDPYYGTGMYIRLRYCRNDSGIALLPGRAVKFNKTAGLGWYSVAGYCTLPGELTGIVDEFLPPGGVAVGDIFWVVIGGPVLATLPPGGATVAVGDYLWAATGAASTAGTDSGRLADAQASLTGLTVTGEQLLQVYGNAMSAAASTNATTAPTYMLVNAGSPMW
jgi:hypothetical protein